jgi:hypothetical protein
LLSTTSNLNISNQSFMNSSPFQSSSSHNNENNNDINRNKSDDIKFNNDNNINCLLNECFRLCDYIRLPVFVSMSIKF